MQAGRFTSTASVGATSRLYEVEFMLLYDEGML